MSLDYYLFCRKSYNEINIKLDEIIDKYNDIQNYVKKEEDKEIKHVIALEEEDKFFFIEAKKYITNIENKFKEKIQKICCHHMVDDSIDISPDISKNIRYCEYCEYTESN
jgi:hypothetical protein